MTAVIAVAARPRSWASAGVAATLAVLGAALNGPGSIGQALAATAPMVVFLSLAIGVAALAVRLGFAERAARGLAGAARGRTWVLFVLVCSLAALLTAVVSLDGAVVLIAPVVLELARRFSAPLRPLVLGVVAVANTFSLAVPTGNPTNLVVLERLRLGLGDTAAHTALPAAAAALLCAAAVGWSERRALRARYGGAAATSTARSLRPVGLGSVARAGVQVLALLVVLLPVIGHPQVGRGNGLASLMAVALAACGLAALANNLPASAIVAAGLSPGPAAYAALIGLSVGALATPQGSVATLIAEDLTQTRAHSYWFVPVALTATLAATVILWLM